MATWFEYDVCSDLAATRRFYGELIGLTRVWDTPSEVAFSHACVQLSFTQVASVERPRGWAFQPGWSNGQLDTDVEVHQVASRSIALAPGVFREAVKRLIEADVQRLRDVPSWVGYWSFVVLDPDGRTVELSDPSSPGPPSMAWPESRD